MQSTEQVDEAAARLSTWQLLKGQLVERAGYTEPAKGLVDFPLLP